MSPAAVGESQNSELGEAHLNGVALWLDVGAGSRRRGWSRPARRSRWRLGRATRARIVIPSIAFAVAHNGVPPAEASMFAAAYQSAQAREISRPPSDSWSRASR